MASGETMPQRAGGREMVAPGKVPGFAGMPTVVLVTCWRSQGGCTGPARTRDWILLGPAHAASTFRHLCPGYRAAVSIENVPAPRGRCGSWSDEPHEFFCGVGVHSPGVMARHAPPQAVGVRRREVASVCGG